ncbi:MULTISPECIES: aldo/keto reductase [Paenibacillus]|uniref:Aldo/keto reductase n=1 Tax=Paenibacillus campinasensis TaxID=66347 RepID=A0A268EY78_9BACL|nr:MULTISPECIES: aldo/keto reductase [Paenibacillus]MUG65339.1 aldo/keto reductase [Paenibacillus campinasensis]PAD78073.1 aldo/keto reductase [Paenibacillus campinasensis]PAK49525.1 aldo/keto reductase [Paenibacillus sp. 7541]
MANQPFTAGPTLNDGVAMPWLGLGVWKTKEGEEVIHAVKSAIAAGYRSIDTAAIYGNEEGVGQAIRESGVSRDELFITTKVWNEDQGYDKTLKAFETSRKKLGLDVIDLYLIHWPGKDKYKETWKALIHLQQEGYVRSIGVSNFHVHHLQDIIEDSGVVPVVNQVELHPLLSQKELLQYAKENNIVLEAWSPLMQGNLDQPVLAEIAQKYNKTIAQVILRWDIQNGIIVIPKSIKEHRIRENADIFDFELSAEDMARIDSLNENKRFGPNPSEFLF